MFSFAVWFLLRGIIIIFFFFFQTRLSVMEKIDESVYLSWANYKRVVLLSVIDYKYNQPVSAGQKTN